MDDRTSPMLLSTGQVAFCKNEEVWILTKEPFDLVRLEVFPKQDDIEKTWYTERF